MWSWSSIVEAKVWDGMLHGLCDGTYGWDGTSGCCSTVVWSCEVWLGAWDGGALYGLTE